MKPNKFSLDLSTLTNRNFYLLLLYAVLLGAVVGLATAAFLLVVHWFTGLIWETIPEQFGEFGLYTLLVCTVGGALVGLGQQVLGNYPKPMQEALEEVRTNGGFDVQHIPHGVIISLISLGFGAALGPEAALIGLAGGLGTWVGQKLKISAQQVNALTYFSISGALGAFFGSPLGSAALPLESPEGDELPSTWTFIPGVFAGVASLLVMLALAGETLGVHYDYLPYTSPRNGTDLLLAIPFGLIGGLLGMLYTRLHHQFEHTFARLENQKVVRGALSGLALGIIATFFPLVLFSGQHEMNTLFTDGATMGGGMLILIGVAKLFAVALLLATGWKGGEFFPMMFTGAAIGMGVAYLIPGAHPMVGAPQRWPRPPPRC